MTTYFNVQLTLIIKRACEPVAFYIIKDVLSLHIVEKVSFNSQFIN